MNGYGVIPRLRQAGFKVKTHAQWGARHQSTYADRLRSRPADIPARYGFLHITVTGKHGDEGMRLVERIGFERFGSGVSYNWVVDHFNDHTIYQGAFLDAKGTHTVNAKNVPGFPQDLNRYGHAVAIMGMPGDPVCGKCVETIAAIFAAEQLQGVMVKGAHVYPHRTFAAKDCPGGNAMARLDDINNQVKALVEAGAVKQPSLVEQANELLEKAKSRAVKRGNAKRAERIERKIEAGPKK